MASWIERLRMVVNGEPVDASVANRPIAELDQRTQWLKALVELAQLGQALVDPDATVESAAVVGAPVWFNPDTDRYEQGLAGVVFEGDSIRPADTAMIRGVVYRKSSATVADIAIYGKFDDLDISAAVSGTVVDGQYFLSGQEAGKLVAARASQSVPVLHKVGDTVWVNPQPRFWAEDHTHRRFSLTCRPAGTHAQIGSGTHTITSPNASLPGWLPASHASFDGHAPANAKFGYNLAEDDALAALWPPYPTDAITFVWDKGQNRVGATEIPQGAAGAVIADRWGIWWMSDCLNDVPWPNVAFTAGEPPDPGTPAACPRPEVMRLEACFARSLLDLSKSLVSSLRVAEGSPLTLRDCNNQPAATGDLIIGLVLSLLIDGTPDYGPLAIKGINESSKFTRGPVVTELIAGENVELASDFVIPADEEAETPARYYGPVTITVPLDPASREIFPATTRLSETDTDSQNGVLSVRYPKGRISSTRSMYYVPAAGVANNTDMVFRIVLIGTRTGQLPPLTFSYRRVPRPGSPLALPTSDTAITPPTMPTIATANQYAEISLPAIQVQPGDTVLLSINRPASDSYDGDPLLLRQSAILG